jgi:hypothetical protein
MLMQKLVARLEVEVLVINAPIQIEREPSHVDILAAGLVS